MQLSTTLRRNLFFLLGLLLSLTLHSTQPAAAPGTTDPPANATTPPRGVIKKASFFFKKAKGLVKKYSLFIKSIRKKYQNDVMLSTIIIALLLILGVGAIVYLLSYLGVAGTVVTVLSIIAFAAIIFWAFRRIRWNAEY